MKKFLVFVFFLFIATAAFFPVLAEAQERIIPCGYSGAPPEDQNCGLCHGFTLVNNIVEFFLVPGELNNNVPLIMIVAVLFFAWGGFYLLISGGDPGKQAQGRQIMTAVIIGLLVAYGAWLIVDFVLNLFGIEEWSEITC